MANRLHALEAQGQAVWLDFLDRQFLAEGGLTRLIEQDGVTGITSNPSIFEKAIGHGRDYDAGIAALLDRGEPTVGEIYEQLLNDLQSAGNAGEYYTPRAVTAFMVDRIDPRPGEILRCIPFDPILPIFLQPHNRRPREAIRRLIALTINHKINRLPLLHLPLQLGRH